ncbi:hypothetical protein B484DRAFT_23406 [Ochromonadaceae sp. CCMP2298]|nr:hypothetical protein B484DRAFT_23406 [Ochromonadaceae sp. CCMP2298]
MFESPEFGEWMAENVGGETGEEILGMKVPRDPSRVPAAYDSAFLKFQSLVDVGKRKFAGGNVLNTATTKEELIAHATEIAPVLVAFLKGFTDQHPGIYASSGQNDEHLMKSGAGLDFRLRWKGASKLHDMLRSTVVCPTITALAQTVRQFIAHCEGCGKNISIVNFYDNVAKYGALDRDPEMQENKMPFGYVGVHVSIPFTLNIPHTLPNASIPTDTLPTVVPTVLPTDIPVISGTTETESSGSDSGSDGGCGEVTLVAEVQFHTSCFFDGSPHCPKQHMHPAYRAFHSVALQTPPCDISPAPPAFPASGAASLGDEGVRRRARVCYEMYCAYVLSITPI